MKLKTWFLSLLAILLVGTIYSSLWLTVNDPVLLEKKAIRIEAQLNPSCRINQTTLTAAADDLVLLCAAYGDQVFLYSEKYPEQTVKLYTMLGKISEWHEIVGSYGQKVIPVVWSYYQDGSKIFTYQEEMRIGLEEIWNGKMPTVVEQLLKGEEPALKKLTPLESAVGAVAAIHKHGHRFLDPFEILPDGTVRVKVVSKTMSMFVTGFTSGINELETKYAQGKKITISDVGWAAFDTAVIATMGVSAVIALKKAAVATAAKTTVAKGAVKVSAAKGLGLAGKTLLVIGGKVAPKAAVLGLGYLVVTRPVSSALLSAGVLSLAFQQTGMSTEAAFVLAWLLVLIVAWILLGPLLWLLKWVFRRIVKPSAILVANRY